MKKVLELKFKDGGSQKIEAEYLATSEKSISIKSFDWTKPHCVAIQHQSLNTQIDCSGNRHAVLVYFEEDGRVSGISYVSPSEPGTFGIITQAKNILVFPRTNEVDLGRVSTVNLI